MWSLAGAGQFGKSDQGIFFLDSFFKEKVPEISRFEGTGYQVRDALHPKDLEPILMKQIFAPNTDAPKVINLGGGIENSLSLKELSNWCEDRFGANLVVPSKEKRLLDAPWIVMDSSTAQSVWNWRPEISINQILEEIASFADSNPEWLSFTS